ncbi:MAG: ABC transporter permease [Desulfatitalea sp. BRH_c12]|nr:MAG: ABC transporter permease [Desulfatitalea sp. BRH_c12]
MKRCMLTVFAVMAVLAASVAYAGPYRISVSQFVEHPALDAVLKGFQDQLREKAVDVQYHIHNAQANMATANQIGHQIMGEKPDLILAIATPAAQACAQALKKAPHMRKTPLLFTAVTDPVGGGLVKDLKHPGANITGVSDMLPVDQHLLMVKTFLPGIKRMGFLYSAGEVNSKILVPLFKAEAAKLKFDIKEATISKSSDVYQAVKSLVGQVDAVFIPTDNTVVSALEAVIKVCTENKLPLFNADVDSVKRGAIAAMGFDYYQHGYQTGEMALHILHGADPATTQVEFQEKLQLHINAQAAEQMGVAIPAELLKRADHVYN